MSRTVQIVLLCEDQQQETFVRRFLKSAGWPTRRLRVEKTPRAGGSAEQYVRERFPIELAAYRRNRHRVAQGLVVVCDGDHYGVAARISQLEAACRAQNTDPRRADEVVVLLIPTWNIETWLAYLSGMDVDERQDNYARLERERDCQPQVNALHEMCQQRVLREPAPSSLEAACVEYRRLQNAQQRR